MQEFQGGYAIKVKSYNNITGLLKKEIEKSPVWDMLSAVLPVHKVISCYMKWDKCDVEKN